ncbi:MAG: tetratricopeptide repeat protein [Crocinitomicaceae bacterium]|nr:tetratricopeptide repeat protein [Crocinitomicaceae bacterium]
MKLAFFVSILLLITSCGEPGEVINTIKQQKRIDVELAESDLFETTKIFAFLENEVKFIEESNKLYLNGVDAFKNKKNLDSADYYLRKSILKEPSGKAYYELGNVFMDKKKYDEALNAYDLAENLDFQPVSKILYNKSCLYSLQKNVEMSGQYLEYALQAGYNNLDHIDKDEDLAELRKSRLFKPAIEKGVRGMSNSKNLFWLQFKKLFPKYPFPHTIESQLDEKVMAEKQYISYDFEKYISEMRDEKYSREVSKGFYHYAQMYETDKYVAVVYIVKEEFMGESAPLLYRMATFTHEGKLIDKKRIGGKEYLRDDLWSTTFNKDKTIDVSILKPTYEKDPDDEGYYENKIVSTEEVGKLKYKLSGSGMIVKVSGSEEVAEAAEQKQN